MLSVKDTTLAGRPCRKLIATRYERNGLSPDVTSITKQDNFFIYNNEDTVFLYDRNVGDFTLLYIFNLNEGDTVCIRVPNPELPGMDFSYIIDSIKTEYYDTIQLRSYYNHTLLPSGSSNSINWGSPVGSISNMDILTSGSTRKG